MRMLSLVPVLLVLVLSGVGEAMAGQAANDIRLLSQLSEQPAQLSFSNPGPMQITHSADSQFAIIPMSHRKTDGSLHLAIP